MDKDVKIGDIGDIDFALVNGKLSVTATVGHDLGTTGARVDAKVVVSDDPKVILDKLVAALPVGVLQDLGKAAEAAILAAGSAVAK